MQMGQSRVGNVRFTRINPEFLEAVQIRQMGQTCIGEGILLERQTFDQWHLAENAEAIRR